jgi:hypothetical protein
MVRMLLIGYCYSIRSERRLCREVELNRWFFRRASCASIACACAGARDEFLLAATAQNLRKLAKLITPPTSMPAT